MPRKIAITISTMKVMIASIASNSLMGRLLGNCACPFRACSFVLTVVRFIADRVGLRNENARRKQIGGEYIDARGVQARQASGTTPVVVEFPLGLIVPNAGLPKAGQIVHVISAPLLEADDLRACALTSPPALVGGRAAP